MELSAINKTDDDKKIFGRTARDGRIGLEKSHGQSDRRLSPHETLDDPVASRQIRFK